MGTEDNAAAWAKYLREYNEWRAKYAAETGMWPPANPYAAGASTAARPASVAHSQQASLQSSFSAKNDSPVQAPTYSSIMPGRRRTTLSQSPVAATNRKSAGRKGLAGSQKTTTTSSSVSAHSKGKAQINKSENDNAEDGWPESLKNYVARSFEAAKAQGKESEIEKALEQILEAAYARGDIQTRDWDLEPPILRNKRTTQGLSIALDEATTTPQQQPTKKRKRRRFATPPPEDKTVENGATRTLNKTSSSLPGTTSVLPQQRTLDTLQHISKREPKVTVLPLDSLPSPTTTPRQSPKPKKAKGGQAISNEPLTSITSGVLQEDHETKNARANRFAKSLTDTPRRSAGHLMTAHPNFAIAQAHEQKVDISGMDEVDWSNLAIVGTGQNLEKKYFRLTAPPHPEDVRSEEVLKTAMEFHLKRYKEQKSYEYTGEQLKSIRQDLTVQCIRHSFTIYVYEQNARISLENHDMEELHQCLSQLRHLYAVVKPDEDIKPRAASSRTKKKKKKGSVRTGAQLRAQDQVENTTTQQDSRPVHPHEAEFTGYSVLYHCYTKQYAEAMSIRKRMQPSIAQSMEVRHAFKVLDCLMTDNYYGFFNLMRDNPDLDKANMNVVIMKNFSVRVRDHGVRAMLKAYRP
eukprot:Clim_evm91s11 gene=Clim_evmTU91s11